MKIENHNFYSSRLNRQMHFKSYGHAGKPILVFPSSGGRYYEYEDFKMIEACTDFIEQGLVRFYTADSIDNETWLFKDGNAGDRARWHNAYDAYIINELIPFIKNDANWNGRVITTGCSMGGYHSLNFFLRHPDVFDTVIALSGIYDARFFVGENLWDFDVYVNSPIDYLPNLNDGHYLDLYRQSNIIVCTGQGAWEEDTIVDTNKMRDIFYAKEIPAWVDYWGYDVDHDWPWWRVQMRYFLNYLSESGKL